MSMCGGSGYVHHLFFCFSEGGVGVAVVGVVGVVGVVDVVGVIGVVGVVGVDSGTYFRCKYEDINHW